MKKTLAPSIGAILVVLNLICGLTISSYEWFSVGLSSLVIIINSLLLWRIDTMGLKDGFRISLDFLMSGCGIVEFFLVACSEPVIEDNGCVIAAVILLAFELIFFIICKTVSNNKS